jgi:hypothetical protein
MLKKLAENFDAGLEGGVCVAWLWGCCICREPCGLFCKEGKRIFEGVTTSVPVYRDFLSTRHFQMDIFLRNELSSSQVLK